MKIPWPEEEILARLNPLNRRIPVSAQLLWRMIEDTTPKRLRQGVWWKYHLPPPRFRKALRDLCEAGLLEKTATCRYQYGDQVRRDWRERGWDEWPRGAT